jgi:NAD(P)-dependent dehydrogenase (short-subunit alcohol dehydrogenase family)
MLSIVVTGVSSGIGRATAELALQRGATVFGSVRRPGDAASLAARFPARFTELVFDVRDQAAIGRAADAVRAALGGRRLGGLVNNVGMAVPGPLLLQPLEEFREQIEIDLVSVVAVTQAFGPLLGADDSLSGAPGRIVMMGSIAGRIGQPFAGAYVASKHALEGRSESLRRELIPFGIGVHLVAPAPVATPIWDKIEPLLGRYQGTPYGDAYDRGIRTMVGMGRQQSLPARRVAEIVWHALTARRPKLRYAPALHPVIEQVLLPLLPARAVDRLTAWTLGFGRPATGRARH